MIKIFNLFFRGKGYPPRSRLHQVALASQVKNCGVNSGILSGMDAIKNFSDTQLGKNRHIKKLPDHLVVAHKLVRAIIHPILLCNCSYRDETVRSRALELLFLLQIAAFSNPRRRWLKSSSLRSPSGEVALESSWKLLTHKKGLIYDAVYITSSTTDEGFSWI